MSLSKSSGSAEWLFENTLLEDLRGKTWDEYVFAMNRVARFMYEVRKAIEKWMIPRKEWEDFLYWDNQH